MDYSELQKILTSNPDLELVDAPVESPPRSLPAQSEAQMQMAVFAEAERRALEDARWNLLFAIPNGQYRRGQRAEPGIRAGVPDLFLPVPNASKGFCGAFIELKVKLNRPSPNQRSWMANLSEQGYFVACIWDSVEDAIAVIEWYLEGAGERKHAG